MNFPFSQRTDWDAQENAFIGLYHELKAQGRLAVDLTESNPTRCSFVSLSPALLAPLAGPAGMAYRPDPYGDPGARRAVCGYYADRGIRVKEDQVLLTASTSEAYTYLFRLLIDPGGAALLPRPSYPLFDLLAGLNDVEGRHYPLVLKDDAWGIDRAAPVFDDMEDVRAFVLVNPNNPTGSYAGDDDAAFINGLCERAPAAVICDEVFWDYRLASGPARSFADNNGCLTFTLSGFSKVIGMPQLKLSWIVVSGPESAARQALRRLEVIADTYLSVNTPVQHAAAHCLSFTGAIQAEIKERLSTNLENLQAAFSGTAARVIPPQGGWYALLRLPDDAEADDVAERLLKEHAVFIHPGYFFDFSGGQFLVASLLPEPEKFNRGIESLKALCRRSNSGPRHF